MEIACGLVLILAFVGLIAGLYFLPSFVAYRRGHNDRLAILFFNGLFGWTFLGWCLALVWSMTGNVMQRVLIVERQAGEPALV